MADFVRLAQSGSIPNIINVSGPRLATLARDGAPEHQITCIAGVAIAAGDLCYVTTPVNSASQPTALKCVLTNALTGAARGMAKERAAIGEAVTLMSNVDFVYCAAGGATVGAEAFSSTNAGQVADTTAANAKAVGYFKTDQILHLYSL
jgi:hypothetical protein